MHLYEDTAIDRSAFDSGIKGTYKGKAEQIIVALYLKAQANGAFNVLATTSQGDGPDVLIEKGGKYYEVEVKSATGQLSNTGPSDALKKVKLSASGQSGADHWKKLATKIGGKTTDEEKIDLIKAWAKDKHAVTDRQFGALAFDEETVSDNYKDILLRNLNDLKFTTAYASIAAGPSLIIYDLTGINPLGLTSVISVNDFTDIKPGDPTGTGGFTAGNDISGGIISGDASNWLAGVQEQIPYQISRMAAKNQGGLATFKENLIGTDAGDYKDFVPFEDTIETKIAELLTNLNLKNKADLLNFMMTHFMDNPPDNIFTPVQKTRAKNFIGEDYANSPKCTIFWTGLLDHLIGVPMIPDAIEQSGRLAACRAIYAAGVEYLAGGGKYSDAMKGIKVRGLESKVLHPVKAGRAGQRKSNYVTPDAAQMTAFQIIMQRCFAVRSIPVNLERKPEGGYRINFGGLTNTDLGTETVFNFLTYSQMTKASADLLNTIASEIIYTLPIGQDSGRRPVTMQEILQYWDSVRGSAPWLKPSSPDLTSDAAKEFLNWMNNQFLHNQEELLTWDTIAKAAPSANVVSKQDFRVIMFAENKYSLVKALINEQDELEKEAKEMGENGGKELAAAVISKASGPNTTKNDILNQFSDIENILNNLEPEDIIDGNEDENI